MSIATMNWALAQRLESCQLQILLYVIADSADPNGLTRHCDPDYMADRARMSRPTMFRRLGELEASGLLTRRKFYSEKGAPIYEIWLNLEAHVDAPIRRRRREDDDEEAGGEAAGADGAEPAETAAGAATEIPESQPETLVRRPKSHLEHDQSLTRETFIYPPISKTLPLPPLRGGSPAASLSKKEAEQSDKREGLWLQFVQGYPGIAAMDQQAARQELEALSIEDAEWAASVLPQLKTELKKAGGRPPKNAHLWLRKAMFRNFPKAKIEPPPPDGVWIAMGSDQDRALRLICGLTDAITPRVRTRPDGAMGYWHPREVGDRKSVV